jgi:hypothetical protein
MSLVQDNYVIQAFAAKTPDEPFDVRILPWTPWSNHHFFDAHVSHPLPKRDVIDAVPIAQQIPWGFVPGEGIYDLLGGPLRCRMLRDVEVDDATSMVGQDEQHEEHFVCHRRHDKEIKGDQVLDMVVQKGLPRRRRWLTWSHPVRLDRRFGHINAQLAQFPNDPRRAPGGIRLPHRLDELADFLGKDGATGGSPLAHAPPVVTEAPPLPGDHRAGLDECQDIRPARPELGRPCPEHPVGRPEAPAINSLFVDCQLMPQCQVF